MTSLWGVLGRRTSSCEALDHVELVRIQGEELRKVLSEPIALELIQERLQRIREVFEQKCLDMLERVAVKTHDRAQRTTGHLDSIRQQLLDGRQIALLTALIGSENVTSRRLGAGEKICEKGDEIKALYIVRTGRVVVHDRQNGEPIVLNCLESGSHLGEIAFLSTISAAVRRALPEDIAPGKCAASWTAEDDVELLYIPIDESRKLFLKDKHIYDGLGQRIREIRKSLEDACARLLDTNQKSMHEYIHPLNDFVDQGIHQGQMLLVLDLESCTRCDECTKACVDSHADGQNRLIRDGLRIENFLVATACRSCHDPVCLIGCPVDAIHRAPGKDDLAIIIEDHCIGCGLCAHHCPFGNIHMAPPDPYGRRQARLAVTCDLCESVPGRPGPMCVHACPHDAALRMDAREFRKIAYGD